MRKIILDTSVYIPMLRSGKMPGDIVDTPNLAVYLSSIVAQELYAGAVDGHTISALDMLCNVFQRNERVLTPEAEDWFHAGKILSQIGQEHGFESIKKSRMVNDVLIAISCKKASTALITANHKDFNIIHEFLEFQFIAF